MPRAFSRPATSSTIFSKPALAEQFPFLILELIAQPLVFLGGNDGAKGREKHGVFPGGVGPVQAQEPAQGVPELPPCPGGGQTGRRGALQDRVREASVRPDADRRAPGSGRRACRLS